MTRRALTVLGVDPGSAATGWAAVLATGNRYSLVDAGVLRPKGRDRPARLAALSEKFAAMLEMVRPDEAAIETAFTGRNPKSAIALAEARGVLLAVLGSTEIATEGYSPAQVKQSIVGTGRAEKNQVVFMVTRLLGLHREPAQDAADAMAVALTHLHLRRHLFT